ncbi:MAG: FkbM family methyltransferase [Pseudomonadota bacterium]
MIWRIRAIAKRILLSSGFEIRRVGTFLGSAIFTKANATISKFSWRGNSYSFVVENRADTIQKCHFEGKLYEPEELEIIERYFPAGGEFIDIGSNVGNHAVFAAIALPSKRVIAFEPAFYQHTLLCFNVLLNQVSDKIEVRKIALSSRDGEMRIETPTHDNSGGATLNSRHGELVRLASGDSEITDVERPFIKIDVEGHEMKVLEGLSGFISTNRPPIFIEVDNENRRAFESWCVNERYRVQERFRRYDVNENFMLLPE